MTSILFLRVAVLLCAAGFLCTGILARVAVAQFSGDHAASISPFEQRPYDDDESLTEFPLDQDSIQEDFRPWWSDALHTQMRTRSEPVPIALESLLVAALHHSKQIKVFSDLPLIRRTAITEADAAFDWHAFLESRWNDISDPVGSTLTTGGPPRFRDHHWTNRGGLRRKNTAGGFFEATQEFGHQSNNSVFFLPNDQGTARLRFSYTQPILRGGGRIYNTSLIVLASIDANVAHDELMRQLQSHLLEITRAYWGLYLERGVFLQRRRVYDRAVDTLKELEGRRGIDTVESQLIRVQAAVAERRSDLVRADAAIRNAQDRIHALVNDPELAMIARAEMIPMDPPTESYLPLDMQATVSTALQMRPEISQALKQLKAASVRLDMARNELLPQLDLVLDTYLSGLRGSSDIDGAWVDQFARGEPSYSAGVLYEVPIYRRAGQARHQRRQLELRQLRNQFDTTVETLLLEVKVAAREVKTSYREAQTRYQSMQAAERQLDYIRQRWKNLPGEDRSVNLYLEDVLLAQERLADAEFAFLQSQTTYNLSLMNLKRATGILLQDEQVLVGTTCEHGLPTQVFDKSGLSSSAQPSQIETDARVNANAQSRED